MLSFVCLNRWLIKLQFLIQAQGTAQPSFISKEIENKLLSHEEEDIIKWAAAGIYSGMLVDHFI